MKKAFFYSVFIAIIVALGGFLLGFDGVVNGGAVPFYRVTFGISDTPLLIGLSSSAIILGGIFGNLSVGLLIDRFGRKPALILTSILFMLGAAGTAVAPNIVLFIIAKFIAGLGVGIAILVAPTYIAELAPPKQRGWLVTFNQLNIVLGLSVAMLSNYFILKNVLDPDINWRWMLGVGFLPAALYFLLLFLVPESPRWLIQKGRDEEALKILRRAGGEEIANEEYQKIKDSIATSEGKEKIRLSEVFSRPMRLVLLIGFGLAFFQQASGINAVLYYAPMIFESAGNKMDAAFLMAIVIGIVFTIATVISMFLIDRLGRKPLLIIGSIIMATSLLIVSFTFRNARYTVDAAAIETVCAGVEEGQEQLRVVLTNMKDVTYDKEIAFFKAVQSGLLDAYDTEKADEVRSLYSENYKQPILKASITINATWVLLGILGFIAGFSISLGPVMWAMFSEIFPNRLRARAIAIVGAANALTSFTVATVFPIELEYIGSANTYMIFGSFVILCLFFVLKWVPETKGRSLETIEAELIKREG